MSLKDVTDELKSVIEPITSGTLTVNFDPPVKEKISASSNAVNVYLYEMQEDTSRRKSGQIVNRDPKTNHIKGRQDPPRYLRLSYMATVWMSDEPTAHLWLGQLFIALSKTRFILLENQESIILEVGQPPVQDRILTELWSTFNQPLRPFLNITASVPLAVAAEESVAHLVESPVTFDIEPHPAPPAPSPPSGR